MNRIYSILTTIALCGSIGACSSNKESNQKLADYVDLERFMGKWYVQGYTPTALDRNAWNPIERYELLDNGRIQTTYQFRKGGEDGKLKTYKPVGTVYDEESNAEWRMRFFGVINAAYYIVYVDPRYEFSIIGHPNKKYAWVMSRDREIAADVYRSLVKELEDRDYDLSNFVEAVR
ncbi:MAG: lipocalin family protein [Verrucomicrobiota bacterium]